MTSNPASDSEDAAAKPAIPPPTTATWVSWECPAFREKINIIAKVRALSNA